MIKKYSLVILAVLFVGLFAGPAFAELDVTCAGRGRPQDDGFVSRGGDDRDRRDDGQDDGQDDDQTGDDNGSDLPNCLRTGWSAVDPQTGYWAEVRCIDHDCTKNGWEGSDAQGVRLTAECWNDGCFVDGWTEIVRRGPYHMAGGNQLQTPLYPQSQLFNAFPVSPSMFPSQNITCNSGGDGLDCLRYGWVAESGGYRSYTNCRGADCRVNGWVIKAPQRPNATASCKRKDCFNYGWTVHF